MENHFKPNPDKWLVFFLVAIGIFMSTLDGSIVNIALSAIMKEFDAPLAVIEWVMMIYLLTASSLLLNFGRLSDIKGRRRVYTLGLLVFSAGSLFCAMAGSVIWLIIARSFQGVGAAMIMACTPALIIETFPASERGMALGMVGAVVASGLTMGPALGGLIIHFFSWQMIFYINIPIGIAAALIVSKILKGGVADMSSPESFDWQGALLLAGFMGTLIFAVTHGYDWGYTSFRFIFLTGISVLSFAALVWVESHILHPVVDPSLLKNRLFILPVISAMILFMGLFMMVFLMPFYLMNPCGFAVKEAGYIMVTPFIALFAVSPISGAVSDRIGSRILCTVGMGTLSLALFLLSLLSPVSTPIPIIWRMFLAGVGTAVFISPNSSTSMSAVPAIRRGVAAAIVAVARNMGMVMGIALAGTIFNSVFYSMSGGLSLKVYQPEMETIFMTAFRYAMLTGSVVTGIGMIIAFSRGTEAVRQ